MHIKMTSAMLLASAMLLSPGHASGTACVIKDQVKSHLGAGQAIRGRCSNNDKPIRCYFTSGDGWTCDGPEGTWTLRDLGLAVSRVCGCGVL